jgi:hypothetical protein
VNLYSRPLDIVAGAIGMVMEYMSRILPDEPMRDRSVGYMRRERLSVFAEPRAGWLGWDVAVIAPADGRRDCRINSITAVPAGSSPAAFCINGTVMVDRQAVAPMLDILIADNAGKVMGLARRFWPRPGRIKRAASSVTRAESRHRLFGSSSFFTMPLPCVPRRRRMARPNRACPRASVVYATSIETGAKTRRPRVKRT